MLKKLTTILLLIILVAPATVYAKPCKRSRLAKSYARLVVRNKQQKELIKNLTLRLELGQEIIKAQEQRNAAQSIQILDLKQYILLQQVLMMLMENNHGPNPRLNLKSQWDF